MCIFQCVYLPVLSEYAYACMSLGGGGCMCVFVRWALCGYLCVPVCMVPMWLSLCVHFIRIVRQSINFHCVC